MTKVQDIIQRAWSLQVEWGSRLCCEIL